MSVVLVTGSTGLVGSDAVQFFCEQGYQVAGIDNDMRRQFFGAEASTRWKREFLTSSFENYQHHDVDIRHRSELDSLFDEYGSSISLIIHAASQPSHDWAVREPHTDFTVNALGTLNMLESARQHCPESVFIFTSTNKVYGSRPNELPLLEQETRWEIEEGHRFQQGIDESMSIDATKHSLFGASKVAADVLVQEYGRYFGMKTACFRAGCITGPNHSAAELHGFLAYVMKCVVTGTPYTVFGYRGKQVRDNIHSADLVNAFFQFYKNPRAGEVYNIGGNRFSHASMLEAIELCEQIAGRKLEWSYSETNRIGDHIWWISDVGKFRGHFPEWNRTKSLQDILVEIHENMTDRWL